LTSQTYSPARLAWQLAAYFAVFIGLISILLQMRPDVLQYLPLGGTNALSGLDTIEISETSLTTSPEQDQTQDATIFEVEVADNIGRIILFLVGHLSGTILVMIPISWTYRAINYDVGFSKTFLRALIVLPICATTTVLLIQDSLALAFGLAALVAAVRFRVALNEAMDGIFIFAAICVGLAAGIGYLGVAAMMGAFFCFSNLILWKMDYGQNPLDDARRRKKRAKLEASKPDPGT
jgi:hypothetical protein